jgi:excisionase family DNA binding protein
MNRNDRPDFLNIDQAAHYLCISRFTVRAWVQQKKIPYYKVGRRVLFSKEDLNDFIARGRVEVQREGKP